MVETELWVARNKGEEDIKLFTKKPYDTEGEWYSDGLELATFSDSILDIELGYSSSPQKVFLTIKKNPPQ